MLIKTLIDCRSYYAYLAGHLPDSGNIPALEMLDRMHELPANDHAVSLAGDLENLTIARQFLLQKGYRIDQEILLDQATLHNLATSQLLLFGDAKVRLWQPCPLLARLPDLLNQWQITPAKALDLACGAGRDAVWLALHGWQVTAVDYLPQALQKTADLAKRFGVKVNTVLKDIEQQPWPNDEQYNAIIVVRYLHRPLYAEIDSLLAKGGVIAYQTFMQGAEKFGSPKNPNRLLREGELKDVFNGYKILLDEVEYLPDGRPVSAFIAQKP